MISGYTDSSGQNFSRFGSDDQTLEGFFDLAGLQIPNGATSAQYQITVESVDPLWSPNAGPYGSAGQVQPSGSVQPIILTVTPGANLRQDILMQGSAAQKPQWYGATSYAFPVQMPGSGNVGGHVERVWRHRFLSIPRKGEPNIVSNRARIGRIGKSVRGKSIACARHVGHRGPGTHARSSEFIVGVQHLILC
jgi:hypothetical protein